MVFCIVNIRIKFVPSQKLNDWIVLVSSILMCISQAKQLNQAFSKESRNLKCDLGVGIAKHFYCLFFWNPVFPYFLWTMQKIRGSIRLCCQCGRSEERQSMYWSTYHLPYMGQGRHCCQRYLGDSAISLQCKIYSVKRGGGSMWIRIFGSLLFKAKQMSNIDFT